MFVVVFSIIVHTRNNRGFEEIVLSFFLPYYKLKGTSFKKISFVLSFLLSYYTRESKGFEEKNFCVTIFFYHTACVNQSFH